MISASYITSTLKYTLWLISFFAFSCSALAQVDSSYTLGVGDKIKIIVFEEPDMSFDVTVDNSGVITYPYLNEIVIKNKTTSEIEQALVRGLKGRVLVNPNIAVSVVEYRPFSIGGEVKSPGNYPFEPNLTLRKAINIGGGVTEWSNGKRFTIERENEVDSERLSLDSPVYPGDVVTILPRRF
jgi:polysaccharide export outer membrane protein